MNIRFKKYLLLILFLMLPVESYGDVRAQSLLKKCTEKGIALGKISIGVGGVALSSMWMVGVLISSIKEQNEAIKKFQFHECCCGKICIGKCPKRVEKEYRLPGSLLLCSLTMIKENSKKLVA